MSLIITMVLGSVFIAASCFSGEDSRMEEIRVSEDGKGFVLAESGKPFRPWGVNYDHDGKGRLIEDYWHDEWETVREDFGEIRELGANVVRVHLQLGRFMETTTKVRAREIARLAELLDLAEENGIYLDLTGLGCYHKADIPKWFDALPEDERWRTQARFWGAISGACSESPAIFCYDLMNEPILPGAVGEKEWLAGELGGKYFVQRIALEERGRKREEIAAAWITEMVAAIREEDRHRLVTVGVIPWATVFPNAKPLFHDPVVGAPLDFVSVHFYPESGKLEGAWEALKVYDLGKPLVIEEFFPLKCTGEEMERFIAGARGIADGWMSFYWGRTVDEYAENGDTIADAMMGDWLGRFRRLAPAMTGKE